MNRVIFDSYQSAYGVYCQNWPSNIKREFLFKINANQISEYGIKHGLVNLIGEKLPIQFYIVNICINFV